MHIAEQTPQPRHGEASHHDEDVYNYDRFHPRTLAKDAKLVQHPEGPRLGEPAPDFALKDTQGKEWRLDQHKGKPVVLIIGSGTCPLTQGSLPGLQSLYKEYAEVCAWAMLYVREAHPGEKMPAHKDYQQKRAQAEYFQHMTDIPWPILVDELDGRVHKAYGLLPNSTFLIDADGKVSFIGEISHGPTLRKALQHLFEQNMRGTVPEGDDKATHLLGSTAYGWEALRRGGQSSIRDVSIRMAPLAVNLWLGHKMKPLLNPMAGRSTALEPRTKAMISIAATAVVGAAVYGVLRRRRK